MSKTVKVDGTEEVFSFRGITNSKLNADYFEGLKTSIKNSQPRLALEYVLGILAEQERRILSLEAQREGKSDGPDMPAGPAPKPNPTKEAEPVEERKKSAPKRKEETTDGVSE